MSLLDRVARWKFIQTFYCRKFILLHNVRFRFASSLTCPPRHRKIEVINKTYLFSIFSILSSLKNCVRVFPSGNSWSRSLHCNSVTCHPKVIKKVIISPLFNISNAGISQIMFHEHLPLRLVPSSHKHMSHPTTAWTLDLYNTLNDRVTSMTVQKKYRRLIWI